MEPTTVPTENATQVKETPDAGRSSFLDKLIEDRRDVPFVRLIALLTLLFWPSAIVLSWPGQFRWVHAVLHVAAYVWFLGPYTLMLHNTSHRRLFKKPYTSLNAWVPWVLGPLFGQSPTTYFAHHIGMHHAEANLADDLSTTLPYQRDSFRSFLAYLGKFLFTSVVALPRYFLRRNKPALFRRTFACEFGYYVFLSAFALYSWRACLMVFFVPMVVTRCAMMAGNWAQHAFVDQATPESSYRNSITCINCTYNERCFNDGYHIGHHVMAARHWSEMPADFERNRARYAKEDAIVFEKVDFFIVWLLLMLKRYDTLADRFVELRETKRSREEIIALMKSRLRRFDVVPAR